MITPLLPPDVRLETRDGRPCLISARFDDVYFSTKSGLDETDQVFINGNRLLERMPAMERLVVAETGFGTGLNFLGLLRHWQALGEDAPRLHYISTELAPLDPDTIAAMGEGFPELSALIPSLLGILPPRWPGRHRRHLFGGKVVVDFLYGDSLEMLTAASFEADAWFLDGFTPWRNPAMWQDELFKEMHRLSAPGATLASFTGSGAVRQGLEDAGFEVRKVSGEPFKLHRIIGRVSAPSPSIPKLNQNIRNDFQDTVIIG
ncbi:MAG: tRNA (5-methylaminomethyl-2-thiouridine)(34)-methyltransferase MnmD, partial [Alphaproteobacteria bacterium]|nr:tRNA (5-methylaminomethyl-2-thiouridine)(34)-methyltransferase MnmD [Alphaproteobacteria bacterium]